MKKGFWVIAGIFLLALGSTAYFGCKKSDSPLGVYAPNGADIPSPTFTPVTGSINVYVADKENYQTGVTVLLVDPNGNTLPPQVTQYQTFAPFPVTHLINGTWKAIVPSQPFKGSVGNYFYESAITFTVNSSTQTPLFEYFDAPQQGVSVYLVSPQEKYGYGGGTLSYAVTYIQPGNLAEPVSLAIDTGNPLPVDWGSLFSLNGIGEGLNPGVNSSALTITIPCSAFQLSFDVVAIKADGEILKSNQRSISRNFLVAATLNCVQNATLTNGNYCSSLQLISTNDCGVTWTINTNLGVYHFTNGQGIGGVGCESTSSYATSSDCPTVNSMSCSYGAINGASGSF